MMMLIIDDVGISGPELILALVAMKKRLDAANIPIATLSPDTYEYQLCKQEMPEELLRDDGCPGHWRKKGDQHNYHKTKWRK
jgi:hypothetical protein